MKPNSMVDFTPHCHLNLVGSSLTDYLFLREFLYLSFCTGVIRFLNKLVEIDVYMVTEKHIHAA